MDWGDKENKIQCLLELIGRIILVEIRMRSVMNFSAVKPSPDRIFWMNNESTMHTQPP